MKNACKSCVLVVAVWFATGSVRGQNNTAAPQPQPPAQPAAQSSGDAPPAADQPAFKPEELEQLLAPIALYPDSLLTQILMASTYPIEVVEADRWVKAHPSLKGDALAKELEKQPWDPSVRSMVNFPDILAMMSQNLSTTVKIGDAFIGQEKEVMDAVQKLRAKAKSTGNLESTEQQKVSTVTQAGTQVIVVESSSPDIVYVPQYSPTVVYGTWPYPAYPPYPYYPPGYVASPVLAFGAGVALGAAWGYAWGNCNWGGGDVDIDINRNVNRNTNINRAEFKNRQGGSGSWKHDPGHRQGAAYRNQASASRVGAGNTTARTTQARNEYRGKAEAGRADIARGGADAARGNAGAGRTGQASTRASGSAQNRPNSGGGQGGALNGASNGGASARQSSDRGAASRSASPSPRAAPSSSGTKGTGSGRGGGGGGRGGGGRR
jgi:hypothetical protein